MAGPAAERPTSPVALARKTIHLFAVNLMAAERQLSAAEFEAVAEGDRGRDAAARRRLVARACLRAILGRCCATEARSLQFGAGPHGKPYLSRPTGLRFNASHSGKLLLVGVALDLEIGVDVEEIRPIADVMLIADNHLSQAERRDLWSLPAASRTAAFYSAWTRKEAVVKATGSGLGSDFQAFDVTLVPDEPARIRALRGSWAAGPADAWQIHAFRPCAGFVAAIAVPCRGTRLRWMGTHAEHPAVAAGAG